MRYIALLCGLVVGGCFSLPTAFLNGLAMGGGFGVAGFSVGALMVGVVGVSWFGGSWGYTLLASRALVSGWLVITVTAVCMIFVLSMSAGFVAAHRGETVGGRQAQIDAYNRAQSDWQRNDAEARDALRQGREKSLDHAEARLQAAKAKLDVGAPAHADAQAEWLSWMSFGYMNVAQAGQLLATWVSVVGELACIAAFTAWSQWPVTPRQKQVTEVEASAQPSELVPVEKPEKPDRSQWTRQQVIDFREERAHRLITG